MGSPPPFVPLSPLSTLSPPPPPMSSARVWGVPAGDRHHAKPSQKTCGQGLLCCTTVVVAYHLYIPWQDILEHFLFNGIGQPYNNSDSDSDSDRDSNSGSSDVTCENSSGFSSGDSKGPRGALNPEKGHVSRLMSAKECLVLPQLKTMVI